MQCSKLGSVLGVTFIRVLLHFGDLAQRHAIAIDFPGNAI